MDGWKMTNNVYVTSNNQSGGITANTVNLIEQEDRALTNEVIASYDSIVQDNTAKNIIIYAAIGDRESYQFANQIHNYLSSKYPNVQEGIMYTMYKQPFKGVVAGLDNDNLLIQVGYK
jgi:hypothetical protein